MKAEPAPGEPNVAADALAGGASIDKVRDILFGVQMRDYDKRFARLEERLVKETTELKDDVKKRLASLEQFMKQEFESLGDRLSSEHAGREGAVKELGVSCNASPQRRSKRRPPPSTTSSPRRSASCGSSCWTCRRSSPRTSCSAIRTW